MSKWIPDRKVWGGGLSALLAWLLVQLLQAYAGIVLPPGSDATIAAGIGFLVSYVLPPAAQDIVKRIDGQIIDIVAANPKIPLEKAASPPPAAKTTVVSGMTGRALSVAIALTLLAPLTACGSLKTVESAAPHVTAAPIKEAVKAVQDLPPEEKWRLTCRIGDGLYLGYVTMVAAKLKDQINAKVEGTYRAFQVACANKPDNYAEAITTVIEAFQAFKSAIPAKAS